MSYRKVVRVLALAALVSAPLSCCPKVNDTSLVPGGSGNDEGDPGDGLAVLRASVFFDPVQMSKRCTEVATRNLAPNINLSSRIGYEFLRKELGDAFPSGCKMKTWRTDHDCSGKLENAIAGHDALANLMKTVHGATFGEKLDSFLKDHTDLSRPVVIAGIHLTTWLEDRTEALADNLPFGKGAARVALQVVAAHIMSWAAVSLVRELEERQGVNPYDVANRACEYLYAGTTHGALSQRFLRTMVVRLSETRDQPGDIEALCTDRKDECRAMKGKLEKSMGRLVKAPGGKRADRRSVAEAAGLNPLVFGALMSSSPWEQFARQDDELTELREDKAMPKIDIENPGDGWIGNAVTNLGCALDVYTPGDQERYTLGDLAGVCAIVEEATHHQAGGDDGGNENSASAMAGDAKKLLNDTLAKTNDALTRTNDALAKTNELLVRVEPLVQAEERRRELLSHHKEDLERVIETIRDVAANISVTPRDGGLQVDFSPDSSRKGKTVEFERGSAKVPDGLAEAVNALANELKQETALVITVVGYHDSEQFNGNGNVNIYSKGSTGHGKECKQCIDSNLALATVRAMNVAALFLRKNFDDQRVRVQGRHEAGARVVALMITLHDH